jgi:hypothetical protein
MAINTVAAGNISLTAIDLEINGTNGTNKSLRALSAAAGKSIPDALSEFSGYSHFSGVISSAGTSDYFSDGNYVNTSSIVLSSSAGTWGSYDVTVGIVNANGTILLMLSATSGSPIFTNSGWTRVKTWNNSSGTGTPLLNYARLNGSNAQTSGQSFTVSNNGTTNAIAYWQFGLGSYGLSTYFGFGSGSTGQARYLEIT